MSTAPEEVRIGVDTGGTFTDLVLLRDGRLHVGKLRSTPHDPSESILAGISGLLEFADEGPMHIVHGSTVATNALLERTAAGIAMLCTAGFEDVLAIGRQTRPELYNFQVKRSPPLVARDLTFGVAERMAFDGQVLEPLRLGTIAALAGTLRERGVASVAVCLLHSYANPAHEQMIAEALRSAGLFVSASHEILPEYREYERWSTTAVNAYVAPLMSAYLARLEGGLPRAASLSVMQSNGGSISAARAGREAVQTILSGPAGGVVGAQALGAASGYTRLITFDMGGTSTDVSLLDGEIGFTMDSLVGDLPVRLPVLDIHTVGAGGGSVAWVDSGGSLRVGPRSAGADPGPVCYGRGDELTVTDANLLLGRLDPAYFLGGRMTLDLSRTRAAAKRLAGVLNLSERKLAEGIVRIAEANMERAIRTVSVARGHDPRDFALLAFGGAGGLHACLLAHALGIRTVLIPQHSGVLSALGMLLADVIKDYSASILQPTAAMSEAALRHALEPLLERAQSDLRAEGFERHQIVLTPTLDMRYAGQAYEISVALTPDFATAFHALHGKRYGYSDARRPTEIVQLRLRAAGITEKPLLPNVSADPQPAPEPASCRRAIFNHRSWQTAVFHRDQLRPGHHATGPALILSGHSTNLVPPGYRWKIDGVGTLIATRED